MERIRVVTYNVLSSDLSNVSRYKFPFRRKDINPRYRMERLQNEITQLVIGRYWDGSTYQFNPVLKNPVICLQEVSTDWHTELKLFFRKINYEFECTNYGNYHNGDMGVAIAFPKCYELLDYKIGRITKSCKWRNEEITSSSSSSSSEGEAESPKSVCVNSVAEKNRRIWEEIKHCKNRYIAVKLNVNSKIVWVATYHMPCSWDCTPTMMAIIMLLLKELKHIVNDDRLILGGDFNFLPDSPMYRYVQTGQVEPGELPLAYGRPYNWKFFSMPLSVIDPLPFTTKTLGCVDGKEFCGTIDHIFYTNTGIRFIKTELSEPPLENSYMPNGKHPSDHLAVVAQFELV